MAQWTLGLDLGTNSVGWALIRENVDNPAENEVVAMGARVFPEGVDRDKQGGEMSRSVARREARGARKVKQRRRARKRRLVKTLREAGMLPLDDESLHALLLDEKCDPYELRARALDEKLSPHEFGRALFHLNQRRGFKSNRKGADKKESGKVKDAINKTQQAMGEAGARTFGQHLQRLRVQEAAAFRVGEASLRNRRGEYRHYTNRDMTRAEFEAMWAAQRAYYPELLTDDLKAEVGDKSIFWQLPLKPVKVGDCELEKGEPRIKRGEWLAQRFRLLKEVNALRLVHTNGDEAALTKAERTLLVEKLSQQKSMEFTSIRKMLRPDSFDMWKLNLEGGKRDKLQGNVLEADLIKTIGKAWQTFDEVRRAEIRAAIDEVTDEDDLIALATTRWGLTREVAEAVAALEGPAGTLNLSRRAIEAMMPYLEEGMPEYDARLAAGYGDTGERPDECDELPKTPKLANPIVRRTLSEMRKVVNGVVRKWGKPEFMRVEMARELKLGPRARKELIKENRENEKINARVDEEIAKIGGRAGSRDDRRKYKLWKEQGETCPYTGRVIPATKLFSNEVEIDHVLPYSRSLDDGMMNLVVAWTEANREKGNQTPWEWKHGDEKAMEAMLQCVRTLPYPKCKRFSQKEVKLDEFIARQLTDTAYIAKEAVKFLKSLYPHDNKVHVTAARGRATSELRWQWGLNSILGDDNAVKLRDDHRHHAVDAVVIAMTTPRTLHELSRAHKSNRLDRVVMPPPWEGFREQVAKRTAEIVVSHRPQRGIRGALHEETNYGATREPGRYVYRVGVEQLTGAAIGEIVDPVVRGIVEARVRAFGFDVAGTGEGKPLPKQWFPKEVWNEPLRMKTNNPDKLGPVIKTVRRYKTLGKPVGIVDSQGTPYRHVLTGNNHHAEVAAKETPNGKTVWLARVVTTYESKERAGAKQAVIERPDDGFVMSLHIGDALEIEFAGKRTVVNVQTISQSLRPVEVWSTNLDVRLRLSTDARPASEAKPLCRPSSTGSLAALKPRKVSVSPIGEVLPCND